MSSIYRKGRDGYYYYQTYVNNPESGKKDKRIFHALRTKDLAEAKAKQYELDMQYEKKSYVDSNLKKPSFKFSPISTVAIIALTIVLTIFVGDIFKTNTVKNNRSVSTIPKKVNDLENKTDIAPVKPIINNQINLVAENITEKTNLNPKLVEPKAIIPKYNVERVERLSGAFEQGKVFVTINNNSSSESQRLLCENLVKRYSEFSNIVICLYANDRSGISLAKGNDETVSIEEQKRSWKAMYTYNSVEGAYFDDNPSGYLGTY
mgnify:CR=1 FL=1